MLARTILLLIAAWALLAPIAAPAKSLYVNNSGSPACSDGTSYASNDSARPWCTIGRATWGTTTPTSFNTSEAARAGDTVYISAGTYVTPGPSTSSSGCRWSIALQPANSGSSGSPITFRGIGTVDIRLAAGYYGPTLGSGGRRNYITWDNVRIDEQAAQGSSCADTGPVVFSTCIGCKLLNSTVRGTVRNWGDNYNAVRLEAVRDITIANNTLSNITGNMGHNDAAIMSYDSENVLIEHNRITDSICGIYIKGDHSGDGWPQATHTVRRNWFENMSNKGIFISSGVNHKIYQNVVKNSYQNIVLSVNASTGINTQIVNNTVIQSGGSASTGIQVESATPTGGLIHNNLVVGPFAEAMNLGGNLPGGMTFEHNVYFGFSAWGSTGGAQISFSTWQGTYRKDSAAPAGIVANPLFVDTTSYKLQAASPALNRGVDILDLNGNGSTTDLIPAGAYVTGNEVIGPGGSPPPPGGSLPAPTNLRTL